MMKKLKVVMCVFCLLLLIGGCSSKPPEPEKVKWNMEPTTLNCNILENRIATVPKDPCVSTKQWSTTINLKKGGNQYVQNEDVVKVFLLAHNANKITLSGKIALMEEYAYFFRQNGVTASINFISSDKGSAISATFENIQEELK